MDQPRQIPEPNLQTPWLVVLMGGFLSGLLIAAVACLLLKSGPPTSRHGPLFVQSATLGIQGGAIVGAEVLIYAYARRHSEHRLLDGLISGVLATLLFCCCSHPFGQGDLSDVLMGMRDHSAHAEQRRFGSFVFWTSALICGFQAGCHVYLWHGKNPTNEPEA
jgi:hypothetical protein